MIKVGTILEFESGNHYEVVYVHSQERVDMRVRKLDGKELPDTTPVMYGIKLKWYNIIK